MRIAVSVLRIDDDTHRAYLGRMQHIFDLWPTVKELAADLGKPYTTVHSWHLRGNIPAEYDADLIAAANKRGKRLTFEDMATARSERRKQKGAA